MEQVGGEVGVQGMWGLGQEGLIPPPVPVCDLSQVLSGPQYSQGSKVEHCCSGA